MPQANQGRKPLAPQPKNGQSKRMKRIPLAPLMTVFAVAVLATGLLVAPLILRPDTATHQDGPLNGLEAVFYKSPTCGCCHVYAQALEAAGVRLKVIDDAAAMAQAKAQHGIPPQAYSCHTFTLDGYVVEGHVPLEALEQLVTERPGIDGIALPGMPIGTPGMPGPKTAPYEILALQAGQLTPYLTL